MPRGAAHLAAHLAAHARVQAARCMPRERADEVPVVVPARFSLNELASGDARALERLRRELESEDALGWFELDCRNVYDTWTDGLVSRVYDVSEVFFNLSESRKLTYVHSQYANESGGYVPVFNEYAYRANTAALLESFDAVRELDTDARENVRRAMGAERARGLGPVDWPVEVPELREAFQSFHRACDKTARILLRTFARAMKIEDEEVFLRDFGDTAHCMMRSMRYPDMTESLPTSTKANLENNTLLSPQRKCRRLNKLDIVGIAEHTDFEFFTLIHQTSVGLDIRPRKADAGWVRARAYSRNDAIFNVLLADAFEILTNGRVKATPHRVQPCRGSTRQSIVRFNGLNHDAKVAPLPCFGKPKYKARTQGDHIGTRVTQASDNLEQTLQDGIAPIKSLAKPPKRFVQMLVLDMVHHRILLAYHRKGEFEGRFTGLIAPMKPESDLTPIDVARTDALEMVGLNPLACDKISKDDLVEVGRFIFHGWVDGIAVEHEFVAAFRTKEDLSKLFLNAPRHPMTRPASDDADTGSVDWAMEGPPSANEDIILSWHPFESIPYKHMPSDDKEWYPEALTRWHNCKAQKTSINELRIGHFTFDHDSPHVIDHHVTCVPYVHPSFISVRRLKERED